MRAPLSARVAARPVDVERAMPKTYLVLPVLLLAGCTASQNPSRPDVTDSRVQVPAIEFRTAFDGYRPFAEEEQKDWRKANEEVGAAGGHGDHK